jgi:uncharacterized protein (DUF2164 family)
MKRKWDSGNESLQRKCIDEIITRVDEAADTSIGVIAAQDIIDIVTEHLAPEIYNKGIADAKKLISEKLADIEVDLDSLEQRVG